MAWHITGVQMGYFINAESHESVFQTEIQVTGVI